MPVIPGRANCKEPIRYDKEAYKGRNVIERCYCQLKDFRRIATRYDKFARNFFSSACIVAALTKTRTPGDPPRLRRPWIPDAAVWHREQVLSKLMRVRRGVGQRLDRATLCFTLRFLA
jgi:hypothetical protein